MPHLISGRASIDIDERHILGFRWAEATAYFFGAGGRECRTANKQCRFRDNWGPHVHLLSAPGQPAAASARASRHTTLSVATIVAVGFAVCLAQVGVAVPATLNGTFQTVLHPTGASQLDWISDAILLPIAALELTFGVLGDLFGRKKLLVGGALILLVGELISTTSAGVVQMYFGQFIAGVGSAALFPTTLAIIASGSPPTPAGRG